MESLEKILPLKFCFILIAVILSCITSTAKGATQDQYVGCFNDNDQQSSSLTSFLSNDNTLTAERCISKCRDTNYMYAAIKNGNTCLCGNDYGVQISDNACNITCSGNPMQYCGGMKTYIVYTVCPIGYYGIACDKTCHCRRQIPCDRMSGSCQNGCHGNWTGPTCNTTPVSQQYIGCYGDSSSVRDLTMCVYCDEKANYNGNNTLESCVEICADKNFTYAGAQFSAQCWCGDSYGRYGQHDDRNCSYICTGNSSEKCGGFNLNSIFFVCPVGNYGKECIENCNCMNDQRCIYRNGSCLSSSCKYGWKGISCNIRDCAVNNGDCYQNETCSIVDLKFSTISQCRCTTGFRRSKIWENCTVDECSSPVSVCDGSSTICINTINSYNCACKPGFERLHSTPTNTCADIDECSETPSVCGSNVFNCTNTYGSYFCSYCEAGFVRSGNECVQRIPSSLIAAIVLAILLAISLTVNLILVFYRRDRLLCQRSKTPLHEAQQRMEPTAKEFNNLNPTNSDYVANKDSHTNDGYENLNRVQTEDTGYTELRKKERAS